MLLPVAYFRLNMKYRHASKNPLLPAVALQVDLSAMSDLTVDVWCATAP